MAKAIYPSDLLYHPDHGWARIDSGHPEEAAFGITWYAQDSLGEIVSFEAPRVGSQISKDAPYTQVESVKAVTDIVGPLSGEIIAVNEALAESPEAITDDPYGDGWLVKVKLSDAAEQEALLDSAAYEATLS